MQCTWLRERGGGGGSFPSLAATTFQLLLSDRLLEVTIDNLEQTRSLVVEGTADGGPMTARFADLCEELARAVTSLLALQVMINQ